MRSRRGSQPSATLFDYDNKVARRDALQARMNEADFWNDRAAAQKRHRPIPATQGPDGRPRRRSPSSSRTSRSAYELAKEGSDDELLAETDEQLFQLNAADVQGRDPVAAVGGTRPPRLLRLHPGGRRRHRGQRLGLDAGADVPLLLGEDGLEGQGDQPRSGDRGRHQRGRVSRGRGRTPTARCPASGGRTGWPA